MRTTFSLSFYCRESKTSKKGLAPLELSININGKRLFINLPIKISPEEFNKKRQPEYIKELVEQYRIKANEIIVDLMRNDIPITAITLREYLRSGGVKSIEVCDIWNEYLDRLNKRIGTTVTSSVYRKYEIARDLCYQYLGEHKEINSIVNSNIIDLYDELKRRYKHSTAAGYFTKIKTVFTSAIDDGKMKKNPFGGIKIDKGHPTVEFLTETELDAIRNADLDGRLDRARDLLLFQVYCGGLAYVDLVDFNPNKMEVIDGIHIYKGKRRKTGVSFTTVVLPEALEILYKYDNQLPFISNQRLNQYAKEVQKAVGIRKSLHTHLMRKSAATMYIRHHIPLSTVSKVLGHSNTAITSKVYAHTEDSTIVKEFRQAFDL